MTEGPTFHAVVRPDPKPAFAHLQAEIDASIADDAEARFGLRVSAGQVAWLADERNRRLSQAIGRYCIARGRVEGEVVGPVERESALDDVL